MSIWVPDRTILEPSLAVPHMRPQGNIKIDWTNYFARGLRLAVMSGPVVTGKSFLRDITGKNTVKESSGISASRVLMTRYRNYWNTIFNDSSDEVQYQRCKAIEPNNITVLVRAYVLDTGGQYVCLVTKDYTSYGSPWYSYHLRLNTSGNNAQFYVGGSSTVAVNAPTDSYLPHFSNVRWTAGTYNGSKVAIQTFYDSGAMDSNAGASSSFSLGAIQYYDTDLHFGDTHSSTTNRSFWGSLFDVFIWDHGKSMIELSNFIRNPYQIYTPA